MKFHFFSDRRQLGRRTLFQALCKLFVLQKDAPSVPRSVPPVSRPPREKTEEEKKEFMKRKYAEMMMGHQVWMDDIDDAGKEGQA